MKKSFNFIICICLLICTITLGAICYCNNRQDSIEANVFEDNPKSSNGVYENSKPTEGSETSSKIITGSPNNPNSQGSTKPQEKSKPAANKSEGSKSTKSSETFSKIITGSPNNPNSQGSTKPQENSKPAANKSEGSKSTKSPKTSSRIITGSPNNPNSQGGTKPQENSKPAANKSEGSKSTKSPKTSSRIITGSPNNPSNQSSTKSQENSKPAANKSESSKSTKSSKASSRIITGSPNNPSSQKSSETKKQSTNEPKKIPSSKILSVRNIQQLPEYPSGCEITATTILLNYHGFYIKKTKLADYMPTKAYYFKNGRMYCGDPNKEFCGAPNTNAYGCFSGAIKKTIENYFAAIGEDNYYPVEYKNADTENLYYEVSQCRPVLVWATLFMREPYSGESWIVDSTNKTFVWPAREHCLVLMGYTKDEVVLSDPYDSRGTVRYSKALFEQRFKELGGQAIVLYEKSE